MIINFTSRHRRPTLIERLPVSFTTVVLFWGVVVAVSGFVTGWVWALAVAS